MSDDNIITNDATDPTDTARHTPGEAESAPAQTSGRAVPREPLSPLEAQRAEDEARQRTLEAGEGAEQTRRRGRIEAETHRVSEEVTRQARERERLAANGEHAPADVSPSTEASPLVSLPPASVTAGRRLPDTWRLRRVLVPLDGSPLAEQALGLALGLVPGTLVPGQEPVGMTELALLYVADNYVTRHDGARYLTEVRDRLRRAGLPSSVTITPLVEVGPVPGDTIVDVAARGMGMSVSPTKSPSQTSQPFDLVVLATHGRKGLGRWLYGSVATEVLEHSSVPVLIVHPPANAER